MNKSLITFVLIMMVSYCYGQPSACTVSSESQSSYFQNLVDNHPEYTVKVYFNIIRDNNSNGGYDHTRIPNIISSIEQGFSNTGIFFEFVCDVQYIDSTAIVKAGVGGSSQPEAFCLYNDPSILHSDGIDIFINQNWGGTGSGLIGGVGKVNTIPGQFLVLHNGLEPIDILEGTTVVHELGHIFGVSHMHRGATENKNYFPIGVCSIANEEENV